MSSRPTEKDTRVAIRVDLREFRRGLAQAQIEVAARMRQINRSAKIQIGSRAALQKQIRAGLRDVQSRAIRTRVTADTTPARWRLSALRFDFRQMRITIRAKLDRFRSQLPAVAQKCCVLNRDRVSRAE